MATPEEPESASEPLLTGYSGRILTALSVGWLTIPVGRQAIPPLLPEIIGRLGLTPFTARAGLTLMWVCYAVCHYPGERLSDHLTRKTVLMGGPVILTAGFATLVWVRTYVAFLSALVSVGIGSRLLFTPCEPICPTCTSSGEDRRLAYRQRLVT